MTSALRRFLPEFEAPSRTRAVAPAWTLLDRPPPLLVPIEVETDALAEVSEPEPPHDPVGEAVAAALSEAEARHAVALAEVEGRAAADLGKARARWATDEGQALAGHLREAAAVAGDRIADAVSSLLEPFLGEAIRRLAIEDLCQAVADLIAGGAGGRIAISGPQDILDALAAALDRSGIDIGRLDLTPAEVAEVAIAADSSAVRTRLGDWMQALRHRLGGEA